MEKSNPYENPEWTEDTYEERIGPPDKASAALGQVIIAFSWLEREVIRAVASLLDIKIDVAEILLSEMSFSSRIHTLGALVKRFEDSDKLNPWLGSAIDSWAEIEKQCFKANEKRNEIIHSTWNTPHLGNHPIASRVQIRGNKRLRKVELSWDPDKIFDVSDYIRGIAYFFYEFFPISEYDKK